MNIEQAKATCANPRAIPKNSRYVIVDMRDRSVLEGHANVDAASRSCHWANDHEDRNDRGRPYIVEALT